jgi:hypothetical protein
MPDRREKPPVKIRQAELFPGDGMKTAFDRAAFHRKGFETPPCDFLPTQKPPASAIRRRTFDCCNVFWKPSSP